jgi:lipopolysaccharide/colanic/teichoic acid biosynthesis glycosyltransferase
VAAGIKLGSVGPIFFTQRRIGRGFVPFSLYKFRTMVPIAPKVGPKITVAGDPRVTRIGRVLRATKLDELPQLLNVIKGDMSLVGPRPEVPEYVDLFVDDYRQILALRPGITDLASIKYRNEAEVLARSEDPEREYVTRILPDKIALAEEYVRRSSLAFDLKLIFLTLSSIAGGPRGSR